MTDDILAPGFWKRVDIRGADECWPWRGEINNHGYGRLAVKRRKVSAHRVAFELHNGPIPEGLHICHRCDNPPCCNPRHLFAGTASDNMRDMLRKGRRRGRGPTKNRTGLPAKPRVRKRRDLEPHELDRMRALRAAGKSLNAIGAVFGLPGMSVLRALRRGSGSVPIDATECSV